MVANKKGDAKASSKDRNVFNLVVSTKTDDGIQMNKFLEEIAKDEKIGSYLKRLVKEDMKRKQGLLDESTNENTELLKRIALMLELQGIKIDNMYSGKVAINTNVSDDSISKNNKQNEDELSEEELEIIKRNSEIEEKVNNFAADFIPEDEIDDSEFGF
ncbi:hypothetical protein [Clostridium perfringens]|uniref:hypothetical protein n=1 Tax=Clostridium perfringens TaxID=1502 RepID=UPI0018E4D820|nr:hypothetical protein [Clostridium perfringens]MBI5987328.1 hypothetical protein [Clostridium perfringens]MBI6054699.1 hypothetical protein [Clostridium perfringens]